MNIKVCAPEEISGGKLKFKEFKAAFKSKSFKDIEKVTKAKPEPYFAQVNYKYADKAKPNLGFLAIGDLKGDWKNLAKEKKTKSKKSTSIGECYVEKDEKGLNCLCLVHQEGGAKRATLLKQLGKVAALAGCSFRLVGGEEGEDPDAVEDDQDEENESENESVSDVTETTAPEKKPSNLEIVKQLEAKKKELTPLLNFMKAELAKKTAKEQLADKAAELLRLAAEFNTLLQTAPPAIQLSHQELKKGLDSFAAFWNKDAKKESPTATERPNNEAELTAFVAALSKAMKEVKNTVLPLLSNKKALSNEQLSLLEQTYADLLKLQDDYGKAAPALQQKLKDTYNQLNPEKNAPQFEKMIVQARTLLTATAPDPKAAVRREQAFARVEQIRQRISEIAQLLQTATV